MWLHPAAWSLFLLLATGIVAGAYLLNANRQESAPSLVVPTIDGGTFDLSAERGRVVVLDLFNVYCEACAILEQDLARLVTTWDSEEVTLVSVGTPPYNSLEDLRVYADDHDLNWTVAQDTDGALEKFTAIVMPTLVVVAPDGSIVFHRGGLSDAATIDGAVQAALSGQATGDSYPRLPLWGLAVATGVASFFSPCAIGLLPGYVAHAVRVPGRGPRTAALFGGLAASGLLLVLLGIGGLAYAFAQAFAPLLPWVAPLAGVLFVLVGLLLFARPYNLWLQRVFAPITTVPTDARGGVSYFLYGIGYGAGAAGCTAPVLLSLVGLAAATGPAVGAGLVIVYAVTAALLMATVTIIVARGRSGIEPWIRRNAVRVEQTTAVLMLGAGVFLVWFAWRAGTLGF